jgi:hypothetical protein
MWKMNEFEFLFSKFTQRTINLSFDEYCDYEDEYIKKNDYKVKCQHDYYSLSGRVKNYVLDVFNPKSDVQILKIVYRTDDDQFNPEQEKYFEPTWTDFTDTQLKRAIKYLTPLLEMKMNESRNHYGLLVFKDKFHLSIRIPCFNDSNLDHTLCITAYDIDLESIK